MQLGRVKLIVICPVLESNRTSKPFFFFQLGLNYIALDH